MAAGVDRLLSAAKGLLRNRHTVPEEGGAAENRLLRLEAITQTALSHLDLDELLDELLERIRDLLDADTAVMLLVDEERDVLVPRATKGLGRARVPGGDSDRPGVRWPGGRRALDGRHRRGGEG